MGGQTVELTGPDLSQGIPLTDVPHRLPLLGHARGEPILFARDGERVYAVGATCTHYGGPLGDGIVVGDTIRCPWHHACFSLRTGEAIGAPALNSLPCYRVEQSGGRVVVGEKIEGPKPARRPPATAPERIVVIGAGAAGAACVEALRREGYDRPITLVGSDASVPYDRPNLSKDYLAGTAPEEWIPLRSPEFYAELGVELTLGVAATAIDPAAKTVTLSDGTTRSFGALLLATGATPRRLSIPGADRPHVHLLRTLADSRAIIAAAQGAKRAAVIGTSFIGLEAAAALRTRGLEVHAIGPEARPLERVLGPELGDFVRALHEEHGVTFHLGETPTEITDDAVVLASGARVPADLVVVGIGVQPATDLAERAGLAVGNGIVVDAHLRTSAPDVFAAGDVARYPDARTGESIRVEHWVVAQRQGQAAARTMLGIDAPFRAVPFFWSQHYDVPICYVGHASRWDRVDVHGNLAERSAVVAFRASGKIRAIATVYRDRESLEAEAAIERDDAEALERIASG